MRRALVGHFLGKDLHSQVLDGDILERPVRIAANPRRAPRRALYAVDGDILDASQGRIGGALLQYELEDFRTAPPVPVTPSGIERDVLKTHVADRRSILHV